MTNLLNMFFYHLYSIYQYLLLNTKHFFIFVFIFFILINIILVRVIYLMKNFENKNLSISFKRIHLKNFVGFLTSLKFFILYCFFIYQFLLFFFKIKILYYFKTIFNSFYFIFIKIPFNLGKFFTIFTINLVLIWPFLFIKYLIGSWFNYFLTFSLIFLIYLFIITYKNNTNVFNFYFYNPEELEFSNFNLYNFLNPSFFTENFKVMYNSNIENFVNRKDFFFSNTNSIGILNFIKNYYITKNDFISESVFNANNIILNLNSLYYLEKASLYSDLILNNESKNFVEFKKIYYDFISKDQSEIKNFDGNLNSNYITYTLLNKLKHLNLIQHKQIYSIYLNAAFFQLNTTSADWYQIKSIYTNNWLSTNEINFYLTNSFFLESLNLAKFIIFYLLNCIFPSDIFFLWIKYSCIEKLCIILNSLIGYINSDGFMIYSEKLIKFLIFSLPDKFLFDLGYIYKIQIYTFIEIIFDHFFGFCLKVYKIYNINIGNHSTTKKLLLLFTDASLQFKNTTQQADLDLAFKNELTLLEYPFLAQYHESELITFSTYSLYTKWRRYCYVIEGSPFFQEQTNIHNYTSKSTPAGLDEEVDHMELQNKLILEELSKKEVYPNLNYWSFWADLNITFDNFDKDIFIKQNILKGNVFPGNLYDCFEFNNIPFFGGDKTILFKTFPTQMSYSFENFFSYGNSSTKLRFHKLFTWGGNTDAGDTENSRANHLATNRLEDYSVFAKYIKNLINLETFEIKDVSFYDSLNKVNSEVEFNFDIIFNFQKQLTLDDFNFFYKNNKNSFYYQENEILDFYKESDNINRIFTKKRIKPENLVSEIFRLVQVQLVYFFFINIIIII